MNRTTLVSLAIALAASALATGCNKRDQATVPAMTSPPGAGLPASDSSTSIPPSMPPASAATQ